MLAAASIKRPPTAPEYGSILMPLRFPKMKHALIPVAPPELLSPLRTLDQVRAFQTESGVGGSLPEVLTDPLGYFLFRYFVESYGDAIAGMTFLEDVVQFKMTAAAGSRAALAEGILRKYSDLWPKLPKSASMPAAAARSAASADDEFSQVSKAFEQLHLVSTTSSDGICSSSDANVPLDTQEHKQDSEDGSSALTRPLAHASGSRTPSSVVTKQTSVITVRRRNAIKPSGDVPAFPIKADGGEARVSVRGLGAPTIASANKRRASMIAPVPSTPDTVRRRSVSRPADEAVASVGRPASGVSRRATVHAYAAAAARETPRPAPITRREMKQVLHRSSRDVLQVLLRGFAISKLAPPRSPVDVWKAAHTEVFPCSGGATHADECKCGTARLVSNELFDTAVALVLQDLESHYFPVFITVNPFFLAFVQLYHFCCTRKPMNLRSWKWIGRIGRGGYGAVFLVQRIETGYLYAVKCIDKRAVKLRRAIKLLLNERKALAACDCPFIPALRYAFQTREHVFMVTDLMTGGDLDRRLRTMVIPGVDPDEVVGMPEADVRFYTAEVALALRHMHQKGIIHRDIKPANVLLDSDGHIQLADLGLAVFLTSRATAAVERRHTFGSKFVPKFTVRGRAGTPGLACRREPDGFWAPEMLGTDDTGKPPEYTSAVDFYSLGCFMFNLLSGKTPPVADHPAVQGAEGPEPVAPGLCDAVTGAAAAVPLPALSSVRDASTPLTARRTRRNACLQPPLWESLLLPAGLSSHAKDLMRALLEPLPDRRLGHNAEDFDRLMSHPWFEGLDWDLLAQRKVPPPWMPPADAIAVKASRNPSLPMYDQCTDLKVEDVYLSTNDQAAYIDMDYCDPEAVQREVIANLYLRGHHSVLKSLHSAKRAGAVAAAENPRVLPKLAPEAKAKP